MSSQRYAIIFADKRDLHALTVQREIAMYGAHALILNPADYPEKYSITLCSANSGRTFKLRTADKEITEDQVCGVWWRRSLPAAISPAVSDKQIRAFCRAESRALVEGFLLQVSDRLINPLDGTMAAKNKPFQLQLAADLGLRIPNTLISNDGRAVKQFFREQEAGVIFKTLTPAHWQFAETRELQNHDLEQLTKLSHAPAIFQEKISAIADIRITVVDDDIFAASIEPQDPRAYLDWRLDISALIKKHELPDALCSVICLLMKRLNLRYGAIDMRLTPEGEYVFLEVNSGGQFLFVEIQTEHQISRALARSMTCRQTSQTANYALTNS